MMKQVLLICAGVLFSNLLPAQDGSKLRNNLPDYIPPTPEAVSLLKADNLSVGYTTGSPNINIPLFTLSQSGYQLPVSLNYASTGVKVDEYASSVGMGWSLNAGGVISRTVAGLPDETRSSTYITNFNAPSPSTQNQALLDFLNNTADKETDVFSFSFPGFSGKFYWDQNRIPVQFSKQNLKIENITDGFSITTDNGTQYIFTEKEISTNRNPYGENCSKPAAGTSITTSWYLKRIILPSRKREITFSYINSDVEFESGISHSLTKVMNVDGGAYCSPNVYTFTECIPRQTVASKFISTIETSDGERVSFSYGTNRTDLYGGKRLVGGRYFNRNGRLITDVVLSNSYHSSRLFLDNVKIQGYASGTSEPFARYSFEYNNSTSLPARLSFGQDWYGYYNGKTSNPSLIPILNSGDVNYATFNNGTGGGATTFGDRSVDTTYCKRGLLTRITYPTGGFDELDYLANRFAQSGGGERLAGGSSVQRIRSYTFSGNKVLEKRFYYRYLTDHSSSSMLINDNMIFSTTSSTMSPGSYPLCHGAGCSYATVTSNSQLPLQLYNGQHLYHKFVTEWTEESETENNGYVEHTYSYFGSFLPNTLWGSAILGTSFNVVVEPFRGETLTRVFKKNGGGYELVKSTEHDLVNYSTGFIDNYVIRKNYINYCSFSPPAPEEFDPFDVSRYYFYCSSVRIAETVEKEYQSSTSFLTKTTSYQYGSDYTYPKSVTTTGSDGVVTRVEYKYPQDYTTVNFMLNRNVVSPVLEEKQFSNNVLQVTKTNSFSDWFANGNIIAPQQTEVKIRSAAAPGRVIFHAYDTLGNVLEVSKENDERLSYIWGYKEGLVAAKIQNASASQVAYSSFEHETKGGWTYTIVPEFTHQPPTGNRAVQLSPGKTVSRTGLTAGTVYIVSYWTKNSSPYTVTGTQSGYPVAGRTINGWTYYEHRVTGITNTSVSGTGWLDELRLYPATALMTTTTHEPGVGVTSQCDMNNVITYFEYDVLGRLFLVRDPDRNIIRKICYNYSGQPENCSVYYNDVQSQSFTKECPAGFTGSTVVFTIPAQSIVSSVSVADANAQAVALLSANGQAYANANGVCAVTCGPSNCSGITKKCINNNCETGIKVYTSSVYDSTLRKWFCYYHYEFSDGSWSSTQTEISNTMCFITED